VDDIDAATPRRAAPSPAAPRRAAPPPAAPRRAAPPPAAPPPAAPRRTQSSSTAARQALSPAPAPVQPVAAGPEFRSSAGSDLETRMQEYLAWVMQELRLAGAAIVDQQGLVVAQRRVGELDAAIAVGVELLLDHVGQLFANDLGTAAIARDTVAGDMTGPTDGHVALKHGERHLGAVWVQTNHGRLYGVLLATSASPLGSLTRAGEGLRTLFAD
ncbi:MAG: hypothetical protein MJE77_42325, partial [Proteobacteria bacterium]|nr:hypothetical protein [Pseudomonadota bacterium]